MRERLKKWVRKLFPSRRSSRRRKIIFILALIFGGSLLYLLVALIFISPAELSLAELRGSWQSETICHESCQLRRRRASEMVIAALKNDPDSRLARQIKRFFFDSRSSWEFRAELISIWREAAGSANPPIYLRDYLADPEAMPQLAAEILADFDPTALDLSVSESDVRGPIDYYFSILSSGKDFLIKREAVRAISTQPDKRTAFSPDQVESLGKMILDASQDRRLRQILVMLLGDYYPLFPDESSEVLRLAYGSAALDPISRALSADNLNRFEADGGPDGGEWPLPEISREDWDEYYNE